MTSVDRRQTLFAAMAATVATAKNTAVAQEPSAAPRPVVEPAGPKIAPYKAACVQTLVRPVFDDSGKFRPEALKANVERVAQAVERGGDNVGAKLYSFSEFCLQAAPRGATIGAWIGASIDARGPEVERLARAAGKANAFIAFNAAERVPEFPGRYFLSGMIVAPNGELVLNYRKLYDPTTKTRPTDVLRDWMIKMGPDSLFPVADTEIGRLGCAVALDVMWPEMVRGIALKGAEVIVNPTASPAAPGVTGLSVSSMVRRVRAAENMAYVLLSNLGPIGEDESAPVTPKQPSEIIDFNGNALATSADGGEGMIVAAIDIDALRRARTSLGLRNWLAQLQVPVHIPSYMSAAFAPVNAWAETPLKDPKEHDAVLVRAIQDLVERGVLVAPGI